MHSVYWRKGNSAWHLKMLSHIAHPDMNQTLLLIEQQSFALISVCFIYYPLYIK